MDEKLAVTYKRFQQLFAALSDVYPSKLLDRLKEWLEPLLRGIQSVCEQQTIDETTRFFLRRCHRALDVAFWLLDTRHTRPKDEWDSMTRWYSEMFWTPLFSGSVYVISNDERTIDTHSSTCQLFEQVNEFERELERRHAVFKEMIGKQKTFQELYEEHGIVCNEYLRSSVIFHSHILTHSLLSEQDSGIEDFVEQIISKVLSHDVRIYLQNSLKKIEIPLQHYARRLEKIQLQLISKEEREKRTITDFIPTIPENIVIPSFQNTLNFPVTSILQDQRWCVVLGDPGYGKTSFLRWLMLEYARCCISEAKNVVLKRDKCSDADDDSDEDFSEETDESDTDDDQGNVFSETDNEVIVGPTKMPILIRVSEFVEWLKRGSNQPDEELTLFNYIGKHTWMGRSYNETQCSFNMLHDFIRHGHALILIDGLDEVSSNLEMCRRIVYLIESFANEHVCTPLQISINDDFDTIVNWGGYGYEGIPVDRPALNGGNQMIITSRITGYNLWRLRDNFFIHYRLGALRKQEVIEFINGWLYHVPQAIICTLRAVQIDEELLEKINTYVEKTRSMMIKELVEDECDSNVWYHPMLLTVACSILFRNGISYSKKRIVLYTSAVNSSLHSTSTISPKIISWIFEHLATYLQRYSASGLTDTFDLERLVRSALRSLGDYRSGAEKELIANVFNENSNNTIAVACGLDAYSFSHRLFQEYFVAMTLVRMTGTNMTPLHAKTIADRLLGYGMHSHYRQPVLLAIGWLSLHLSENEFDVICVELVSRKYGGMPIGALLLLEAANTMHRLPSTEIFIIVFDILFAVEHESHFDRYIVRALNRMDENVVIESITEYIKLKGRPERFCLFLNRALQMNMNSEPYADDELRWLSPSICHALWTSHINTIQGQANLDLTLWLMSIFLIDTRIDTGLSQFGLQTFFIERNIQCSQIHPLILSLVIALTGGLDMFRCDDDVSVIFSPRKMHRPLENTLAQAIIAYFNDDTSDHSTKIYRLIEYCEQTIRKTDSTDRSSLMIDLFIAWICLRGVHEPNVFKEFYNHPSFASSLARYKQILIHLHELYGDIDESIYLEASTILNEVVAQSHVNISSFTEAVSIALTRLTTREQSAAQDYLKVPKQKYCSRMIQLLCPAVYGPANEKEEAFAIDQNKHPYQLYNDNSSFYLTFLSRPLRLIFERIILTNRLNPILNTFFLLEVLLAVDISKERRSTQRLILLLQQLDPAFSHLGLDSLSIVILLEIFYSDLKELPSSSAKAFIECKCRNITYNDLFESLSRATQSEDNMHLFISSISLARLVIIVLPSNYLELIDQAINCIYSLNEQILKLFALCTLLQILYCYIDRKRYDKLLTDIVNTTEQCLYTSCNLPLLVHTLLLVLSGPICQTVSSHIHEKCFENLINRLSIMPDNEEHAHDQEIAYMSIQYQYPCKLPNIILARTGLGECLNLKSKQFRDYFDILIPTSSLHTTLLSTMYLSELAVDIRILEKFVTTADNKCLADQIKIILKKSQPIFTHAASLLVDTFLRSEVIYSTLLEIEICLRACTTFEPTSRYILEKWLYEYRYVKDKCSFTHIAVILLVEQGILSSLSTEILCQDILPSDIDWIQIRARTCLNNVKCGIPWSHSLCSILLKHALAHAQLSLYHVKDIQKLIILEREKATCLSYFQLIHSCSDEVKLFIEDSICSSSEDDKQHLASIIFHLGHFVKKSDQWFHILESLLHNDRLLYIHPAVTHVLNLHRDSRKIIINFINNHVNDSALHENTLIACLQALYSKSGDEDELNQLDAALCRLRHSASSSILQNSLVLHAGACYLYYRCEIGTNVQKLLTCLDRDVSILYQIIMLNERAHLWANQLLYRFSSQLMSKFIVDLSDILWGKISDKCIAIFLLAVDWTVKNDPKNFCQAVRTSSIDETLFKSGLYQTCIRLESPLQTIPCPSHLTSTINHYSISRICLHVYSAFGSLTAEWIEIFFIHALDYNQYSLQHSISCIKRINHVEDRDLIEILFPYLKSTSMRCRYLVAYLLLHIASIDLLSFVEVYGLLGEMINDSTSQQPFFGQDEKRHTLSEEIRHLLLNYSCIEVIEQDSSPLVSWTTAEVHYLKASDAFPPVSCVVADD